MLCYNTLHIKDILEYAQILVGVVVGLCFSILKVTLLFTLFTKYYLCGIVVRKQSPVVVQEF